MILGVYREHLKIVIYQQESKTRDTGFEFGNISVEVIDCPEAYDGKDFRIYLRGREDNLDLSPLLFHNVDNLENALAAIEAYCYERGWMFITTEDPHRIKLC